MDLHRNKSHPLLLTKVLWLLNVGSSESVVSDSREREREREREKERRGKRRRGGEGGGGGEEKKEGEEAEEEGNRTSEMLLIARVGEDGSRAWIDLRDRKREKGSLGCVCACVHACVCVSRPFLPAATCFH